MPLLDERRLLILNDSGDGDGECETVGAPLVFAFCLDEMDDRLDVDEEDVVDEEDSSLLLIRLL